MIKRVWVKRFCSWCGSNCNSVNKDGGLKRINFSLATWLLAWFLLAPWLMSFSADARAENNYVAAD